MKFSQVKITPEFRGIKVKNWKMLRQLLNALAQSEPDEDEEVSDTTETDPIVEKLLNEAKEAIKRQGQFKKDFGYEVYGHPFFKAQFTIERFDKPRTALKLGISQAYLDQACEGTLAKQFGLIQGMLYCAVEIGVEPAHGNSTEICFEPILRKLDAAIDTKLLTGEQIIAASLNDKGEYSNKSHVLQTVDELEIILLPCWRYNWVLDKDILKGAFEEMVGTYRKKPTALSILIRSTKRNPWRSDELLPIWDANQQKSALELANKIAEALQK